MGLYQGEIVGAFGPLRSGKSMRLCAMAFRHWLEGYAVVTNVDIFPDKWLRKAAALGFDARKLTMPQRITSTDELFALRGRRDQRVFIWWDEIQATLDSRAFSRELQQIITQWSILIGKYYLVLGYTSPHPNMIDIRIRLLTTRFYLVQRSGAGAMMDYYTQVVGSGRVNYRGRLGMRYAQWAGLYWTEDDKVSLLTGAPADPTSAPPGDSPGALVGRKRR